MNELDAEFGEFGPPMTAEQVAELTNAERINAEFADADAAYRRRHGVGEGGGVDYEETWQRYESGQPAGDEAEAAAYRRWADLERERDRAEGAWEAQLEARFEAGYEAC